MKRQVMLILLHTALAASRAHAEMREGGCPGEAIVIDLGMHREMIVVCGEAPDPGMTCPPGWVPSGGDCVPYGGSGAPGGDGATGGDHGGGGGGGGGHTPDVMRDLLSDMPACSACHLDFMACASAAQLRFISCDTQMRRFAELRCASGQLINGGVSPANCADPWSTSCEYCQEQWMHGDPEWYGEVNWPSGAGPLWDVQADEGLLGVCARDRAWDLLACFSSTNCTEVCQ